jgi:hypothetical protein
MTIRKRNPSTFKLGILFVHGIGTPRSGDTLVRWGDVLLNTIKRATQNNVVATIEHAGPSDEPGEGRFEAAVRFGRAERWLFSEGWWANAFPAPSYRELVSWSVRALPWSVATHIAERYWQVSSRDSKWARKFFVLSSTVVELSVALLLTPVFIGVFGLALLLGLLPIPQIRNAILAAQSILTATVGDSLAFVESPIRAALMKTCILDGLARLKQRCERTVIVAHSQGAAVVIDALGGLPHPDENRSVKDLPQSVPDTLVTFGAGTKKLANQKVLSARFPNKMFGTNPVNGAIGALLGAAGLSCWLYLSVRLHQTTIKEIAWALLLLFLSWVILGLIGWLYSSAFRRLKKSWHRIIITGTFALLFIAELGAAIFYAKHAHLPLGLLIFLFTAFFYVAASMAVILRSKEMKYIMATAAVQSPKSVRWIDLYASADPVPNGPTSTKEAGNLESIEVWNLGSTIADHTAYWDNRDGFVLRIANVCAETAQSPWKKKLPQRKKLPDNSDWADQRAAWRVRFLQIARWSAGLAWFAIGAFLWSRDKASVPITFDLPSWAPVAPVRLAVLVTFIGLAVWITSSVLRWLWGWWVRAEQEELLAHADPGANSAYYRWVVISCMGTVVWMLIFTTYLLMKGNSWVDLVPRSLNDTEGAQMFFVDAIVLAIISTSFLLWRMRPPEAPNKD